MRILVVGAGAIGGYVGARLLEARRDVTFLVRPRREAELARGLFVRSKCGDVTVAAPPTILAEDLHEPFDLILVSCKAYDLEGAMTSFAPAVGPATGIVPLLNGMRHLELLDARFGSRHVLGGWCLVSAAVDSEGRILHLNPKHLFAFGERDGSCSPRAEAIAAVLGGAKFDVHLSRHILQEMCEKWVFIATVAGINCLMRGTLGDIVSAGAADVAGALLDESVALAARIGFVPRQGFVEGVRRVVTDPRSRLTASMLRDVERGAPTEADHILGDLLARGAPVPTPVLRIAYAHLKVYAARRARETDRR